MNYLCLTYFNLHLIYTTSSGYMWYCLSLALGVLRCCTPLLVRNKYHEYYSMLLVFSIGIDRYEATISRYLIKTPQFEVPFLFNRSCQTIEKKSTLWECSIKTRKFWQNYSYVANNLRDGFYGASANRTT